MYYQFVMEDIQKIHIHYLEVYEVDMHPTSAAKPFITYIPILCYDIITKKGEHLNPVQRTVLNETFKLYPSIYDVENDFEVFISKLLNHQVEIFYRDNPNPAADPIDSTLDKIVSVGDAMFLYNLAIRRMPNFGKAFCYGNKNFSIYLKETATGEIHLDYEGAHEILSWDEFIADTIRKGFTIESIQCNTFVEKRNFNESWMKVQSYRTKAYVISFIDFDGKTSYLNAANPNKGITTYVSTSLGAMRFETEDYALLVALSLTKAFPSGMFEVQEVNFAHPEKLYYPF